MTTARVETDEERELREEAEEEERMLRRQAEIAERKRLRQMVEEREKERVRRLETIQSLLEEVDSKYVEDAIHMEEDINSYKRHQERALADFIEKQRLDFQTEQDSIRNRYRFNPQELDSIRGSFSSDATNEHLLDLEDRLRELLPRKQLHLSKTPRTKQTDTGSNHSGDKPKGRAGCKKVDYDVNNIRMTDTLIIKQQGYATWTAKPKRVAGKNLIIELTNTDGQKYPSDIYKTKGFPRSDTQSIIGAEYASHSAFLRGYEAQHKGDIAKVGSMPYKYIKIIRNGEELSYAKVITSV
jgi:hypothetical protein